MKTSIYLTISCFAILSILSFSSNNDSNDNLNSELKDSSNMYLDGTYWGQSKASYTGEPYWGHVQITVENGLFTNLNFIIRDSSTHENVDSMYGVIHYAGNPTYQQQCVNDGHGIEIYPQQLLITQDLDNIDAISGATWSYNIFRASTKNALKDAKIPNSIESKIDYAKIFVEAMPNPFGSTLNLKYNLIESGFVALNIYDNQGKLIKKLVDNTHVPGIYSVQWLDCPASGIYYYTLQIDDVLICRKIISIR